MRQLAALCALGLLLVLVGCSSDTVKPDGKAGKEAGVDYKMKSEMTVEGGAKIEGLKPDTKKPGASKMGEGCKGAGDCGGDAPLCLMGSDSKGMGICSADCTPDNAETPLINEDSCPNGFLCADFAYTTKTYNYCLKKCSPSLKTNDCPASSGRTCHPASTRYASLGQTVCWYLACATGKDCPVQSEKKCQLDTDCTSLGTGAFCELDTSLCAVPGVCGASGLCAPHTKGKAAAKVGDPCKSDFDCPNNGRCLTEENDPQVGLGVSWRNGYCTVSYCSFSKTLTEFACPTGSTCNNLFYGGLCNKTCTLTTAGDCRGNPADKGGDYECYAWNNLTVGGVNVSTEPVCTSPTGESCDSFGKTLDCSSLGEEKGNTTNMSCRDRFSGAPKANKADPSGICLDDTASGAFEKVAPDAGIKDSSAKDAGAKIEASTKDLGAKDKPAGN